MKQIPNIFTLLNLLLGCMALVCLLQPGITIQADEYAQNVVILPERMVWASCLIAAAAVVDFLDGMVARWMNATSEIGAQLDSLSDVVSFGVAPGMIAFQFLRYSFAQERNDGVLSPLGASFRRLNKIVAKLFPHRPTG